jgi:hypothetical protein
MLAAVDFDMRFTYVLAGWEGSTHDATITTNNLERSNVLKILEVNFYLDNARYACYPRTLPPFRPIRYHLNEFSARHYPKTGK